jgi:hypothetical protein
MTSFKRGVFCLVPLAACLALGCGTKGPVMVPVSGTVTLDGQALEGASVNFVPVAGGRQATGQTDKSGKFALTSIKPSDGAPVGKYKVGVSKLAQTADRMADPSKSAGGAAPPGTQLSGPPIKGPAAKPQSLVPAKYVNPDTSGFTVEVKSGMEPVKLELKSG